MDAISRGALIGMVLGDGYINTTNGKRELSVAHSDVQRDYVEHKAALVRKILGGKFNVREYANGPNGYKRCAKFVSSNVYWGNLKAWIYPNGKKQYTRKILDMLTPEGIAIWYMDDGHARRNIDIAGWVTSVATNIATMCSIEEAKTIILYFVEAHDVKFNLRCKKGSPEQAAFFIECNTAESRKFARIVQPYIIPSMMYKISHVADLDSHECRTPIAKCPCGTDIFDNRRTGLCSRCYSRKYYREVCRFRDTSN